MEFAQFTLDPILRWLHILAGIVWIGHLYFFNFVNGPFAATMSPDTKKAVVPELMPRALYFFRWGAAWTWITGVLLLGLLYHYGMVMVGGTGGAGTLGTLTAITLTFAGFTVYDAIQSSSIFKDQKIKNAVCFVLVAMVTFIFSTYSGMGYRGYVIHVGAMFGTTMAFNVWFRIWPAQQKIITAIKSGQAPDAALVGLAGLRSRHNTYMSAALIWMMIESHTMGFLNGLPLFGTMPQIGMLLMILVSWHVVFQLYRRAGQVKGF